ncbi:MAG: DUF1361 domain-containing protein [Candidatus Pacebacteria bacterium]|nr:DUF1361 domain-containing protein [Candidatus Paceibacterota bacterium]
MTMKRLLYIVGLFSLGAMVLNIGRLGLADNLSYAWLNWNLFLALVPIFFAWLFMYVKNVYVKLLAFILWLGFLPNSPYIVTDFIHLADVGPRSILWYDGIMIFLYTIAGMVSWIGTSHLIKKHMNWGYWFICIIGVLSGFGIYLGRYIRFNTWDVVRDPNNLFMTVHEAVLQPALHKPVVLMSVTFTFIFILFMAIPTIYEKTKN